MGLIGPQELMVVFGIVVLLFGASKLPELARSLGKATGEFKKAQVESTKELRELEDSVKDSAKELNKV
jgi:sec-independent protein translocase protein TatA